MAVAQGEKALYNDLKGYYTSFNAFISSYGGNIGQLTVPAAGKKIEATDINNLNTKITAFKNDEYLGTKASWWTNASVTVGTVIKPAQIAGITSTISYFSQVKCRNKATNNYSNNGECCNSNNKNVCCDSNNKSVCCNSNNKSVCCNSNNKSNCCNSNNKSVCCNSNNKSVCCNSNNKSNCCNSNNKNVCCNSNNKTVCCNTNSTHGNACSNGTYSFLIHQQINGTAYNYVTSNQVYAHGQIQCNQNGHLSGVYICSVSCTAWQQKESKSYGSHNGQHNFGVYGTCTVTCGYSTHSQGCQNSNHGQTCANSNHNQSCTNSTHNQTCNNGTHNQTCNNGTHNQTCNNSKHTQTCNNGTHNQTCNNSTHNQTCANSTHNQTCNNSQNGRTCSNTQTIDITCSKSTNSRS